MSFLDILILSLVEGVTEFLPISSTGHLILTAGFLGLPATALKESFIVSIQLGAVLAAVFFYSKSLLTNFDLLKKIFVSFLPTGILGLIFYTLIKDFLNNEILSIYMIFIGGVALLLFEYFHSKREEVQINFQEISYKQALIIGLFQAVALVPGVSRSASTIMGGLWLGLSRKNIIEFSFLLAIPTMLAASALSFFSNFQEFSKDDYSALMIGFVASFVVALFVIKFLIFYTEKYTFKPFAWYRIILGLVLIAFFLG